MLGHSDLFFQDAPGFARPLVKTLSFGDFSLPITFSWKTIIFGYRMFLRCPFPEVPGVSIQHACSLLGNMAVLLGPFSSPGIPILSPVIFGTWVVWILGSAVVCSPKPGPMAVSGLFVETPKKRIRGVVLSLKILAGTLRWKKVMHCKHQGFQQVPNNLLFRIFWDWVWTPKNKELKS